MRDTNKLLKDTKEVKTTREMKMLYPEFPHLYKYYSYNKRSLAVLINKKVWLPSCKSFNDPYDSKVRIALSKENKETILESIDKEKYTHDITKITKDIEDNLNAFVECHGVFCMCEENNNQLMWSHYADKHQGFCMEFERTTDNYLGNSELLVKIKYKDNFPTIKLNNIKINEKKAVSVHPVVLFHYTKSSHWALEKEWRIYNKKVNCEHDFPGTLTSVIFGMKMPQKHKEIIRNILKNPNLNYKEAYMFPDKYKIGIRDLN